jgi:MFS superfamily sulfate permease-like transporter
MTYLFTFVLGAWVGVLLMCLMFISKSSDQESWDEVQQVREGRTQQGAGEPAP